jgi:hypothetical protein
LIPAFPDSMLKAARVGVPPFCIRPGRQIK